MATRNGKATATNRIKKATEQDKANVVRIYRVPVKTFKVTVVGDSDLIACRMSDETMADLLAKQEGGRTRAKQAKAVDPYKACLYMHQGEHCFPVMAFKRAMVDATTSIPGNTISKVLIEQCVHVNGDFVPLKYRRMEKRVDQGRNKANGAGIVIKRPSYVDWSVDLTITINEAAISQEECINLLNLAGFAVAVGAWRVQKKGQFGRFHVKGST